MTADAERSPATPKGSTRLRHGRLELALHRLGPSASGDVRRLLLLHDLGERSPSSRPPELSSWPGAVWALDFTGHGASDRPVGGGYTPEALMADVDTALREIGPATLLGTGLGAFIALLAAGARPGRVRGAILRDGPGGAGGGPEPPRIGEVARVAARLRDADLRASSGPDPRALLELSCDARPPGYAAIFLRQARHLSALEAPIAVIGEEPWPPWLERIAASEGVARESLARALARFGGS